MADKMIMNIAICDDEPVILEQLVTDCTKILATTYELRICASVNAEDLLKNTTPFQLAVLDVQLCGENGIKFAERLLEKNPACRIIFVSGFTSVVSTVYEVPHFCFILKDQLQQQLPKFLNLAAEQVVRETKKSLQICHHRKIINLSLGQIVYMERQGHVTSIVLTTGETLKIREKLTDLMQRISAPEFCRCHISYAVNLTQIRAVDGHYLQLSQGAQIPVSRTYEKQLWKAYGRYLSCEV